MDAQKLRAAAILVLSLGEKYAANILASFSQQDARRLIAEIDKIESISDDEFVVAMADFLDATDTTSKIDKSVRENIKTRLLHSIGSGRQDVLPEKVPGDNARWIKVIRNQPASMVVGVLRDEHPQVIAAIIMVIFNNISSDSGIQIIKLLSHDLQKEILSRIAKIGIISRVAIDSISEMMRNELHESDSTNLVTVDGADTMASIIPYLDREVEHDVVNRLGEVNIEFKEMIEGKIFPFEKLVDLDKKSLQVLLSEISNDDLLLALKGAEKNVREVFFKNMSAKSADILKDEMDSKGPVKLSAVTAAQKKIVQTAKKLYKEEKIFISYGNANDIVY